MSLAILKSVKGPLMYSNGATGQCMVILNCLNIFDITVSEPRDKSESF